MDRDLINLAVEAHINELARTYHFVGKGWQIALLVDKPASVDPDEWLVRDADQKVRVPADRKDLADFLTDALFDLADRLDLYLEP